MEPKFEDVRYYHPEMDGWKPRSVLDPAHKFRYAYWFRGFQMYGNFLELAHNFCNNWFGPDDDRWHHGFGSPAHGPSTTFRFASREDAETFRKFWPMIVKAMNE